MKMVLELESQKEVLVLVVEQVAVPQLVHLQLDLPMEQRTKVNAAENSKIVVRYLQMLLLGYAAECVVPLLY